jgi:dihydroorotase
VTQNTNDAKTGAGSPGHCAENSSHEPARITIRQPDDWHLHLRDGAVLARTVADSARSFARAIIMPNLAPPVLTTADALAYRERIMQAMPSACQLQPLMTLYLTERTTAEEIVRARDSGQVFAVKMYPAGATTNSDSGVTDFSRVTGALDAMQACAMPLLIHGEVTDPEVDVFDREAVFIETVLSPLVARHPELKIVLEHITTADAVQFVEQAPVNVAATITAHHLLINRNAIFAGGLRPHMYCLPVAKRERHRLELLRAATGGNGKFFLGTDSAPHARPDKESGCGCAGLYTAPVAMEMYAEAFESVQALDRLDDFAGRFGAEFYGLPLNEGSITLEKRAQPVADELTFGEASVVPFRNGEQMAWSLVS